LKTSISLVRVFAKTHLSDKDTHASLNPKSRKWNKMSIMISNKNVFVFLTKTNRKRKKWIKNKEKRNKKTVRQNRQSFCV